MGARRRAAWDLFRMDNLHAYPLRDEMFPRQQKLSVQRIFFCLFCQKALFLNDIHLRYNSFEYRLLKSSYFVFIICYQMHNRIYNLTPLRLHTGYKTFICFTSLKNKNYAISSID